MATNKIETHEHVTTSQTMGSGSMEKGHRAFDFNPEQAINENLEAKSVFLGIYLLH